MGLLQQPLERKLSAMLGAEVTFEKLHISLLGGSIEAQGMTVVTDDPTRPLLTVQRIRAEISIPAALKKEIVVRSLTVEKPVVTITRNSDGQLNLPRRTPSEPNGGGAPVQARQTPDRGPAKAGSEDSGGSWKFEAQKVLVVDGDVRFRDAADGYAASCQPITAELKQGFGRLIRSKSDKGIVVILDSRVTGKRYGKIFLDALPECKRVVVKRRSVSDGFDE